MNIYSILNKRYDILYQTHNITVSVEEISKCREWGTYRV